MMTNQEAIEIIKSAQAQIEWSYPMNYAVAFDMAISALQARELNETQKALDTISRQDAIDAAIEAVDEWDGGCNLTRADMIADAINNTVPSAQSETSTEIQDVLGYLDAVLHPLVSPDNWNVYSELHDMISRLSSAQSDNSCDGCKYENAEDGVLVPCGFCKRSHPDNYERRTDGQVISE